MAQTYKLKDYPKNISVASKALRYGDERFIKLFQDMMKRNGQIKATDAEILAWRDAEKAKRFPKAKAKAKVEKPKAEKKPVEKPKKTAKKIKKTAEKR